MGEKRNAYKDLVGKPEGKRPLGIPRPGLEHNIKMDRSEAGWKDAHCLNVAEARDRWRAVVNAVINVRVP
jgi:hypothetical protein